MRTTVKGEGGRVKGTCRRTRGLLHPSLFTLHLAVLLPAGVLAQQPLTIPDHGQRLAHTYSLVAWDSATGDLGVVVQSKFPNVRGLVPWAEAGVGAVATQSLSNTQFGEKGLPLMKAGATAEQAMRQVMSSDTMLQDRQVGMVDARGNSASFTGRRTFDWAGGRVACGRAAAATVSDSVRIDRRGRSCQVTGGKGAMIVGRHYAAQGNIIVSDQTVKNMADAFEQSSGDLSTRLLAALKAGQAGGGDKRGMQSAAMLVVRKNGGYLGLNDRLVDISVYDAPDPIAELERLLTLHKLHFFPSDPADLVAISPDVVRQLEPILLREPAGQREKWLAAPVGTANQQFLEALRNFMYWENYDVRVRMDGKIDRVVLADILSKHPSK